MNTQPTALRLADEMERGQFSTTLRPAAAELRRLHTFNQQLMDKVAELEDRLGRAAWNCGEKVRANEELLKALREILYETGDPAAANAIAKASGEATKTRENT